jgi:transglutaminase-like putative cysteine protease
MKYRVVHHTEYLYPEPVTLCHNEAHLCPRASLRQQLLRHDVQIDPLPAILTQREDFFGNAIVYFAIQQAHTRLAVTATSEVELVVRDTQLDLQTRNSWEDAVARTRRETTHATLEARQYTLVSPMVATSPAIADYAAISFAPGRALVEAVHDLMGRIHRDFTYDPGFTTIATPLAHVFEHRRGVCQDFAHLAIACLRAFGLAARYVSGYIETFAAPGQAKLIGADASHAWFSVYDPDAGWLDFDPTNNQIPIDQHITIAWGRDYADITPLKGIIFGGGATHHAQVAVDMQRLPD